MPTSSMVFFVKHNCSSSQRARRRGTNAFGIFLWYFSMRVIYLFAAEKHCVFPAGHRGNVIGTVISVAFSYTQTPRFMKLESVFRVHVLCCWEWTLFHLPLPVLTGPVATSHGVFVSRGQGCNGVSHGGLSESCSKANRVLKVRVVRFF